MAADHDRWFGAAMSADEVRVRSIRGAGVTFVRGLGVRAISFVSTLALARLLTPADFGLVASAGIAAGLAGLVADYALSRATFRYQGLTHAQASNVFWLKLVLAAAMTAALVALAPQVAAFFGDPRAEGVAMAMAAGLVVGSMSSLHGTLLRRAMRFGVLARIGVLSTATTVAVSVLAAISGLGYWSLVLGSLAAGVVGAVLTWQHCDWRPAPPQRGVGTGAVVRLATRMFGMQLVAFGGGNLSSVIIARSAGPAALAQFHRASGLQGLMLALPWEPVDAVAASALVRLAADPARLRNFYYKMATLSVMAGLPVAFAGLALPGELVRVLFGPQWGEAAALLPLLALGVLPLLVTHTAGWVNASIGTPRLLVTWSFIGWGAIVAGTLAGAPYGPPGIALALSLTSALIMVPCMRFAFHGSPLRVMELARALARPVGAALVAGAAGALLLLQIPAQSDLVRLIVGMGSFLALYALLLLTAFGQRRLILDTLAELRPRAGAAA